MVSRSAPLLLAGAAALLLAVRPAAAQGDAVRLWTGHRAVVEGRYADAVRAYREAERGGTMFAGIATLAEIVEDRRRLGTIAPADTHRIAVVFITDVTTVGADGRSATRSDVTDQQRAEWHIYLGLLQRVVEGMSDGRWTLAIETRTATATMAQGAELKAANPDHLGLGRWFFELADSIDTFITISNANSPNFGLARRYPFIEGVLYGPHRGMMELGAGPSFLTLLHEFFHVIEWGSGGAIRTAHGFQPDVRAAYPAWTGATELDYYRWHFRTTLPPLGWRRLNPRTRFVAAPERSVAVLERLQAGYAGIPLARRQEARRLTLEADRLARRDPDAAISRYEGALALSPWAPEALAPLVEAYRRRGQAAQADSLATRLAETRAVAGFVEVRP
jgi:hypothetical protein